MREVTATVSIGNVPIQALEDVQSAMLMAGYKAMRKAIKHEMYLLDGEPSLRCASCEHAESDFYCGSCIFASSLNIRNNYIDNGIRKGGNDGDV